MKTVIIGANHAGIAAANTLLDNYPEQKVVMIDRNSNLSYLGCGTALWWADRLIPMRIFSILTERLSRQREQISAWRLQ